MTVTKMQASFCIFVRTHLHSRLPAGRRILLKHIMPEESLVFMRSQKECHVTDMPQSLSLEERVDDSEQGEHILNHSGAQREKLRDHRMEQMKKRACAEVNAHSKPKG